MVDDDEDVRSLATSELAEDQLALVVYDPNSNVPKLQVRAVGTANRTCVRALVAKS